MWPWRKRADVKSPPENAASEAPKPKEQPRQPMFSSDAVAAILQAAAEQANQRNRPRTMDWCPYNIVPDKFGPVVKKLPPKMAMAADSALMASNQTAIQAWMAGGMLGSAASQGLLFMGYPYLSELAQRPEFRLFGEIRAEEMTRMWTKHRGTDDESTKQKDKPAARNKDDKANRGKKGRSDTRNKEIEAKIKELADFERDLKVRDWFKASAAQDSFMGISHLYLDLKGADVQNMQDPELKQSIGNGRDNVSEAKLDKGCLRGLRTIEAIWCYPTTYNAINPLIETWYDPQVWYVMGTEIHKSRLLTFIGRPVPDILKPAYAFGGLSMTQMAQPYVDIWLRTRQSVADIVHSFSVMCLATDLATTTQPGGSGGGNGDILARVALFNLLRDNQGVFLYNKGSEDFKNVSAPLSGLDELQAQTQEHMASVARIPAVKMFGIQPKGLNATSEGELRAFNDTIHGAQEHLFRAHLTTVYDIMQISLWGERDPDITYDFLPLQEPTPKEKADILKSDADRLQVLVDAGLISQEEGRTVLVNNPESGFDGLDPDDVPDLLSEEETGLIPQGAGRGLEAELEEAEGSVAGEDEAETQIANAPPAGEATGKIRRDIDGDDQPTEAEARRQAIVTGGGKDGAGRDE